MSISEVCIKARDLILRDGWVDGGTGWINSDGRGWCLEGALGYALGLRAGVDNITALVNHSEVGQAIRQYLNWSRHQPLHEYNDRSTKNGVLRLLAEVAAKHTDPVEITTSAGERRVLPPMPVEVPEKKPTETFRELVLSAFRS